MARKYTNWRTYKTKTGEFRYRDRYLKQAYKSYRTKRHNLESKGYVFRDDSKVKTYKEFKEEMNNVLDDKLIGIIDESDKSSVDIILSEERVFDSKRKQNNFAKKIKEIPLPDGLTMSNFYGKAARDYVAWLVDAGIVGTRKGERFEESYY